MDLNRIAGALTTAVTPRIWASLYENRGYTAGPNFKQVPSYAPAVNALVSMQPVAGKDIEKIANLNMQDVVRAFYIHGNAQGVVRPFAKGGDLICVQGAYWLVTTVLETWPDWSKVAATLQRDMAPPAVAA